MHLRASRVPCVLALLLGALLAIGAAPAQADGVGKVRFVKEADSTFDHVTDSPSPATAEWMRTHYWRQKTYAPYFDSRTSWYPNAWTYKDAYAIYTHGEGEISAERTPDWVLKDAHGNRLYIPFDCHDGSCPQYAADIGNPDFRAFWIHRVKQTLGLGAYRGLFIDDVNLELSVSNGDGDHVAPIDPRTGTTMTAADWRRYMAEFMEQIANELRASHPGIEIAHNQVWFAGHDDPFTQRALLAADVQNLERGVVDDGLQGGGGQFGIDTFLDHIDWLHAHGKGVVLDSYADTRDEAEYNLAAYYLVATERDGLRTDFRNTPGDWWSGYDVDLGQPRGARYRWNGLWRRDYQRGFAVLNEPHAAARTLSLPADAAGPDGARRTTVTLPGASGRVVVTAQGGPRGEAPAPRAGAAIVLRPVPNPRVGRHAKARLGRRAKSRLRRHVKPRLGRRAKSRLARRAKRRLPRSALVRGRVRGATRGRVVVRVQRRVHGRWRTVRHTRVHLRKARFKRLFRQLPRGRYRVQAKHRAPKRGTARSTRHFRVRH